MVVREGQCAEPAERADIEALSMRILFYLPVVTPWWFESIVAPLIRACAGGAEVHVIVPPRWRNTGVAVEDLMGCADLDQVAWHIWDGEDHPSLRTSAADNAELLALVEEIDADYTICRSADIAAPRHFPGKVRFLMEGTVQTLPCWQGWAMLEENILEHGALPALDPAQRVALEADFAPFWEQLTTHWRDRMALESRDLFLERADLPADRRIIAMPLEYEHPENFFLMHRRYPSNAEFVREVAAKLDDRFILAVTNHPLNLLHVDNRPLERAIAALGGKVRMLRDGGATDALLPHADGIVLGDTKSIAGAAFFGTPIYRRSRFATAPWMRAYEDFDAFLEAIAAGRAERAAPEDVRLWHAFHVANNVIDLRDDEVTAADVIDRFERPVSPERWQAGRARIARLAEALEAA